MSIEVQSVVHVGIPVNDMERSLQFYHEALGLKIDSSREVSGAAISAGVQVPNARIKITLLDAGNTKLELLQYLEPKGRTHDRRNNDVGASHVAFVMSDIQGTYERLQELGVPCNAPPYPSTHPEGWGWFYARDPDGITVEFNGPLNQE